MPYDPSGYAVAQKNAEWADTFEGGTTNLAQRRRHVEDQEDFKQRQLDAERQALEQEAMHNRTVQTYLKDKEELQMAKAAQVFKFQTDSELHQLNMQDKAQDIRTSAALEKQRLQESIFAKEQKELQAVHNNNFIAKLKGKVPGTPDFINTAAQGFLENPAMDKTFFKGVWEVGGAPADLTPEQVVEQLKKVKQSAGPDVSITANTKGGLTLSDRAETTATARTVPVPSEVMSEVAKVRATQAQRKVYLDRETDPVKKASLQSDLDLDAARLNSYEKDFPQLATAKPPSTNTTEEAYKALKSGETFYWNGKPLVKK